MEKFNFQVYTKFIIFPESIFLSPIAFKRTILFPLVRSWFRKIRKLLQRLRDFSDKSSEIPTECHSPIDENSDGHGSRTRALGEELGGDHPGNRTRPDGEEDDVEERRDDGQPPDPRNKFLNTKK